MRRSAFWVLALLAMTTVSCTQQVRYSPAEMEQFPPDIQGHIKQGEVVMGMTQEEVRYAWGAPSEVDVLMPTPDGKMREEWVYKDFLSKKALVFTDKKLTEFIGGSVEKGQ